MFVLSSSQPLPPHRTSLFSYRVFLPPTQSLGRLESYTSTDRSSICAYNIHGNVPKFLSVPMSCHQHAFHYRRRINVLPTPTRQHTHEFASLSLSLSLSHHIHSKSSPFSSFSYTFSYSFCFLFLSIWKCDWSC